MPAITHRLAHEIRNYIPPALFFLAAFELLALSKALMLKEYGIHATMFLSAAIGGLVVAKVVLILDHVPLVNRPDKPLIYNVLWKTFLYATAVVAMRFLEHLVHAWIRTGSVIEANRVMMAEVVWPHIIVMQMWVGLVLLTSCTLRELTRALGRERVRALFFSAPGR